MSGLERVVRTVGNVGSAVSIAGRTLLSVDTNPVPEWEHVTKVDPEDEKQLPLAYPLFLQHTGGVSVGGSRDVTERNTEETFELVNAAGVTAFHEPSAAAHVTDRTRDQAAFLAVPEVLNGDSDSLVGTLGEGIEHVKEELAPKLIADKLPLRVGDGVTDRLANFAASWLIQEAVFEAYIIMNTDSAAAREANVGEADRLDPRQAKQRAMAAERHLESEVIYLEYSGTYGGDEAVDLLGAIDDGVDWSRIWYGGGLDDRENAQRVLEAGADAVVVGNVFHDVADEEARLVDAALDDLPADATRDAVEDWVAGQVDAPDTSAAKFLSTVVTVPDPDARAVRYLAAGVHFALQLRAVTDGLDDPDEAVLRRALSGETVPGETAFADARTTDARPLARRLGLSVLADAYDVDLGDGFESRHLAVSL